MKRLSTSRSKKKCFSKSPPNSNVLKSPPPPPRTFALHPKSYTLNPKPFNAPEQFQEMSLKLGKKLKELTASASSPAPPAATTNATKPVTPAKV